MAVPLRGLVSGGGRGGGCSVKGCWGGVPSAEAGRGGGLGELLWVWQGLPPVGFGGAGGGGWGFGLGGQPPRDAPVPRGRPSLGACGALGGREEKGGLLGVRSLTAALSFSIRLNEHLLLCGQWCRLSKE